MAQNTTGTSPTNNSTNVNQTNNNVLTNNNINALSQLTMPGSDDLRYHGTELVLLYDYKAQGMLYPPIGFLTKNLRVILILN